MFVTHRIAAAPLRFATESRALRASHNLLVLLGLDFAEVDEAAEEVEHPLQQR